MFLKECYFIFMDLALDGHRQLQTNFSTLACDKIILLKEYKVHWLSGSCFHGNIIK